MRRIVTTLLVLSLAAPFLAGCAGACRDPEIRVPDMKHSYVVDQHCYAVDRHGNPFPKAP